MLATSTELRTEIVRHPWEAIALAFAAGAYVAFDRSGTARRTVLSSLGAAAIGTVRDVIEKRFPLRSRSWLDLYRRSS